MSFYQLVAQDVTLAAGRTVRSAHIVCSPDVMVANRRSEHELFLYTTSCRVLMLFPTSGPTKPHVT